MSVSAERIEPLSEARHFFHGKPPAAITMRRYVTAGIRGVVLESVLHLGKRHTSREAVARFEQAISVPVRHRTTAESSEATS
ncbi:DUF1580 domain-containing protein [Allorhodopirellula solitaria]|uniref:Uncharacterized protein n=1 Tax=Allorhodopirellula solitaria TaxID=2527987 RepID=A0A5C5YEP1_9BACT|nr:hypothetical protein CA85_17710 [Allorhodopirellula solitaria]